MELGFIGLGRMGFSMARRLVEAGHNVVAFDTRPDVVEQLESLGAQAASSPRDVADRVETALASLPSLQASLDVATGADGVIHGARVKRFVDLSTVGARMAARIADSLADNGIAQIDSPSQWRGHWRPQRHTCPDGLWPQRRGGDSASRA